jgi:hypothetical protein
MEQKNDSKGATGKRKKRNHIETLKNTKKIFKFFSKTKRKVNGKKVFKHKHFKEKKNV